MTLTPVASLADLTEGEALSVDVDGLEIAIVRVGDEVFAIRDECSHSAVALSEGYVDGYEIECHLHGSCFDVRTGKPLNFPATQPVPTYPITVEGDQVFVALTEEN